MLPSTDTSIPAGAEPSLFAAAHPFVGSVHCATFTHAESHPAAASGTQPGALPASAGSSAEPLSSKRPAYYQLFGEGPFEPTPGGAPVFLGRVEQLRTLLRLADPSPMQPGSRLPGGGTGVGLAVHKCGPFFVLDGDTYPCAMGPPVTYPTQVQSAPMPREKCDLAFGSPVKVAEGPVASSPSGGDAAEAPAAAGSELPQPRTPSVRAPEGEQPLPVVPFMSLEEILFGARRPSVTSLLDSNGDLDHGKRKGRQVENCCSSAPAAAPGPTDEVTQRRGQGTLPGHSPRPASPQSLVTPRPPSPAAVRPNAGSSASSASVAAGPGLSRKRSREHLPVPLEAPAALSPLGSGWLHSPPPAMRVTVKNTFVHVEDEHSDNEVSRTHSAPAALQGRHRHQQAASAPSHRSAASEWAIMPSREAQQLPWDLRQLLRITAVPPRTPPKTPPNTSPTMRPMPPQCFPPPLHMPRHALQSSLPLPAQAITQSPPLAQFSGAIRWSFGEFLLLIGCDMLVFRGAQPEGSAESAPHRWRLGRLPDAVGHLDSWLVETLEGAMERTSISEGSHLLPLHGCVAQREGGFDPEPLLEQGRNLLCFLRHHCLREGGTYWLFREVSESGACGECKLFDLSPPDDAGLGALALCLRRDITSPTFALPLAHLCFRLAGQCKGEERCRLLQKALSLLELTRTLPEHRLLYTTAAASLAILRMAEQQPSPSLSQREEAAADGAAVGAASPSKSCETGRSSVALWYLEECIRLLGGEAAEVTDAAGIRTEAHLAEAPPAVCEDSLEEASGTIPVAGLTGSKDLLVQVHMYYAAVIIKLVRDIAKVTSEDSKIAVADGAERISNELATCAVVQLVWLCRGQLSLQRMSTHDQCETQESVALLEREILELLADAFGVLTAVDLPHVPWPPDMACDRFRQAIKNIAGRGSKQLAQHSAQLLSQLNALQRGVWDEDLSKHPLLLHAIVGEEAAQQAWDLYGRAAQIEGPSRSRQQSSGPAQSLSISLKQARAGRSLAASAWIRGHPSEANGLLRQTFKLAAEAGDVPLQRLTLLDAAEIRARHAEALATSIPLGGPSAADDAVFMFAVEQYAEYCRALALCRAAAGDAGGSQRLATLELKLGVHLLQFGSVQEHLLDGPTAGSLQADVEDFGGALAGVGSASTAWRARLQDRSVADLAVEHLQRALRLFEGNGEETAAVHFQLAEAYALQLENGPLAAATGAVSGEKAAASRRAAALKHLERAAASFEGGHHWRDAAAAHRKYAELQAGAWEAASGDGLLAAKAFSALVEAECRFLVEPDTSGSVSAAVSVLRAGMGDLIRAALQRAEKSAAGNAQCASLRELYRNVLRGEKLPSDAGRALMVTGTSLAMDSSEAVSAGQADTSKRRRPGRRGR